MQGFCLLSYIAVSNKNPAEIQQPCNVYASTFRCQPESNENIIMMENSNLGLDCNMHLRLAQVDQDINILG